MYVRFGFCAFSKTKAMKIKIALSIVFCVAGICAALLTHATVRRGALVIDGVSFQVEIADNAKTRARGLQDRISLQERHGMLFVFEHEAEHAFWMKHVLVPLDIIWIRDSKIVDFTRSADVPAYDTPDDQLPTYSSLEAVDMVLEVPAGTIDAERFFIGDSIEIQ